MVGFLDHRVAEKLRLAGIEKWRKGTGRPRAELQKNLSSSIRNACQWARANTLNSELLKPEIDFLDGREVEKTKRNRGI
jgi:hypothetical protein